ncbi:hypothetical protein NST12_15355 [Bacillus sp. FSL W8-1127]|uniref:hypothetical protein n=1 Tax=Bacillus sp. FSL W8-1127 TaxID=2954710 RepID=UPI0030F5165D
MTITEFLHHLETNDVDIWIDNSKLYIGSERDFELPKFKANKEALKKRLLNNEFTKSRGWLVGNFGEVYAYQYSLNGYVFIERNEDETVNVYRCQFNQDGKTINIKGLRERISFSEAYQKAKAFLDWFYSKNPSLRKGSY